MRALRLVPISATASWARSFNSVGSRGVIAEYLCLFGMERA